LKIDITYHTPTANDEAILTEMLQVHEQRQALMSRINSTYNRYRQQMSSGSAAAYASEAGMWQLREEMEVLCNKYIQFCHLHYLMLHMM
jgi:hypothetical protein